mmetsp:Transcript_45374/g.84635  ORF Transcript_45374/g.84635 Transcript_45374/m.84635 type:complete len:156 (+) Transcript_45374:51-518(+)
MSSRKLEPFKQAEIDRGLCDKEFRHWAKNFMEPQMVLRSASSNSFYRLPTPGEPVTIWGLRRRPELNGVRAEILSDKQDEFGRLTVRLGSSEQRIMKIQPSRLNPELGNQNVQRWCETSTREARQGTPGLLRRPQEGHNRRRDSSMSHARSLPAL